MMAFLAMSLKQPRLYGSLGAPPPLVLSLCYLAKGQRVESCIHLPQISQFSSSVNSGRAKKPQTSAPTIGMPNMFMFMIPAIEYRMLSQLRWLSPSQCCVYFPDPANVLLESMKLNLPFKWSILPSINSCLIVFAYMCPKRECASYSVTLLDGCVAFKEMVMLSGLYLIGMNGMKQVESTD